MSLDQISTALPSGPRAIASVKPALASIPDARLYLGGPSRSKFYADLLPHLEKVKIGTRTFVTLESLDRLIEALRVSGRAA